AVFAGSVAVAHHEGSIGTAVVEHQVMAEPRDSGHLGPKAKSLGNGGYPRQRLEIVPDDLRARRQMLARRSGDAVGCQQRAGGLVDVVVPRGEDTDMSPLPDGSPHTGSLLEHGGTEAPFHEAGSGSEAYGSRPDHGDGKVRCRDRVHGGFLV